MGWKWNGGGLHIFIANPGVHFSTPHVASLSGVKNSIRGISSSFLLGVWFVILVIYSSFKEFLKNLS